MTEATPTGSAPSPSGDWDVAARTSTAPVERGLIGEFLHFAWEEKWWWILPSVLMVIGLGVMLYAAQGSQIAPFFYALF
ncbi:MAG: hypothetical protein EXS13_13770 [Planctomycetes bacterium]|nr:hypothetical protein [Planctomycetota bacterium]